MHRFLHADMMRHTSLRDAVVGSFTMESANDVIDMARNIHASSEHDVTEEQLSWYVRHRVGRGENNGKERGGEEEGGDNDDERDEEEEEKKEASLMEEEECPCDVFGEVCADDGDY